jgi:predicted AlkP superfamily pyrophosphatase or phosphodiesterase
MREIFAASRSVFVQVIFGALFICMTRVPLALAENKKLLIVSIDGLRPDVLLRADAPAIRALMARGSFTFYSRTTDLAVTLPSHTSMLTGVSPTKHKILWNDDRYTNNPRYPAVPTLFSRAKKAGLTTALIAGKSKFVVLAKPGTIDWQYIPSDTSISDQQVASEAERIIRDHNPDVTFVHFPNVDVVGHSKGWGSSEQIAAIHDADLMFQKVESAFQEKAGSFKQLVILTTDHGGAAKDHGKSDLYSRYTPFIIAGSGIKNNFDLTQARANVRIEDAYGAACHFLAIPAGAVTGKNITASLKD